MLNIKKWMAKVSQSLAFPYTYKSWSNIATPTATYYDLVTYTCPAKGKYLILFGGGNGSGTASRNRITAVVSGASGYTYQSSPNNAGGGNQSCGFVVVETGATAATVKLQAYGYDTSITNMNGDSVMIRLKVGGG